MKSGLIPIPVSRTEKVYNPYPALLPADCETFTVIVPPSGVNFIALLTQFIRTWLSLSSSASTLLFSMSSVSNSNTWSFFHACSSNIYWRPFITFRRLTTPSSIWTFPDSIRLISRTSFISARRCSDEIFILSRHLVIFSLSSRLASAICVNPIMAFSGVRISWLMLFRKAVFALLARSACRKASSIIWRWCCSCATIASTFLNPAIILSLSNLWYTHWKWRTPCLMDL